MKSVKYGILTLFIVAAIIFLIIRMRPKDVGRAIVAQETRQVIVVETGEIIEVTIGDWEMNFKTDPNGLLYKLDKEGKALSAIRTCVSCGQGIINPRITPDGDYRATLRNFRCPKCGNPAVSRDEWEL